MYRKIIITIPKDNKKWQVSFGHNPFRRSSAELVLRRIEIKLNSASQLKVKTAVILKDDQEVLNESLPSLNSKYLLWCTVCFLEEYINEGLLIKKEKLYKGELPW